ncbi:uncharacterized protein LOC102809382 [Saccoglossus kowalevskii]|uniref:Protein kinase domain-containing protein, cytoplasmic-like n=1 Tax=Saccoglossus kowalevskii TaxID=10224 RepID=A0ABM0MII4_SACKO|nr:PREDICTED: protein kinase domain-containing protein, cytoplasmic-like [Saccoglossus kowalevskii]
MGSLLITDFKLDQMLLVDGVLKLGDLDDINNIESDCQDTNCGILQQNCKKKICAIENTELDIQCVNNKCIGFNAKFNLFKFNHHVFTRVLHNPPANVSFEVKNIQDRLNALNITATELYTSLLAIQYT